MSKNIYDLSIANQSMEDRKVLVSDTGKKYDVSFLAAIVNRKYYKQYADYQTRIISIMQQHMNILEKVNNGLIGTLSKSDLKIVEEYKTILIESSQCALDLIVYVMRSNGYEDFNEDELLTNFSSDGVAQAIDFIMGINQTVKKK